MAKRRNLSSEEWSNVLLRGAMTEAIAENVMNEEMPPWNAVLLQYTDNSVETLELGSGTGQHSALLAFHGKKTTLLDWSPQSLNFSKRLFTRIGIKGNFLKSDLTKPLPFKNNSFDTVFSVGVLEHFSEGEIRALLKEAFRVTRRRVIMMAPNGFSTAYRIGKWYMEKTGKWPWGGERPFLTLRPYFQTAEKAKVLEFSVGAKHSLNFLMFPKGEVIKRLTIFILRLKDHPKPALFRQGYLLVTMGEKI